MRSNELHLKESMALKQEYMDQVRNLFSGGNPLQELLLHYPVVASATYYVITILMAKNLRSLAKRSLPNQVNPYIADMITTFSVCACSWENATIQHLYGWEGYSVVLFVLVLWGVFFVKDSSGNPCTTVVKIIHGELTPVQGLLHIVCQTIGGFSSFLYASQFWSLAVTAHHGDRYNLYQVKYCYSALTVDMWTGFGIEFGATFLDLMLMMTTFTSFFVLEVLLKIAFGVGVVVAGIHLTGMYLNPVNASNQNLGCRNTSLPVHFFVYWVGPLSAVVFTIFVRKLVRNLFNNIRQTTIKKSNKHHQNGLTDVKKSLEYEHENEDSNEVYEAQTVKNGDSGYFSRSYEKSFSSWDFADKEEALNGSATHHEMHSKKAERKEEEEQEDSNDFAMVLRSRSKESPKINNNISKSSASKDSGKNKKKVKKT